MLLLGSLLHAGPDPVQTFFLPLPEGDIQRALVELQPSRTIGQTITSVTSITTTRDNTILYFDQWENGYEIDIANPVNVYSASNLGGTQIWGDDDPSNGIPPGFVDDIVDADAVIALINDVAIPRNPSTFLFDARDKISSTKAIAMTRAEWADNPGTVLAGAVEVYSNEYLGSTYEFPIGEDISALSDSMFEYVAVFVMATEDGTNVTIDLDGAGGQAAEVRLLNQGENYFASGVQTGGTVVADENVQVHLITGNLSTTGGRSEARWYTQLPRDTWSNEYYNPVGSSGTSQPTRVFLYNPNGSAIDVDYETFISDGTINIAAGGVEEFTMPASSGAVFLTQGGEAFFGSAAVAAGTDNGGASNDDNDTWDWGFSLVPEEILTPQIVVGWGPGADDVDDNGVPDAQGSPVWVAVTESTVVYIDYDGDASTGPLTDPNGNQYDTALNLSRFQQAKVYDNNDNDQTSMKLYTVDGTLLTAAWGQDASTAGAGNPFLDLGTTVPPFPFPQLIKTAVEVPGLDGDGLFEPDDTVEYTISVKNLGAIALSDLKLSDDLPNDVTYVPGTTSVDGVAISDDATGTVFPLDGEGIDLPTIGVRATLLVTFRATLNSNASGSIVNTAFLDIGPEVLVADSLTSSSSIEVVNNRVGPDVEFTDASFTPVTFYGEEDDVYMSLDEPDFNINDTVVDTITVVVQNSTNGDFELLTLTETSVNSGIFQNTAALPSSPASGTNAQDGTLNFAIGDTLSVTVTDSGDPVSIGTDTDTVVISPVTETKKLYLSDDFGTPVINRVEPTGSTPIELPLGTGVAVVDANYRVDSSSTGSHTMTVPVTVSATESNQIILISVFYEDDQDTAGGSYAGPDIDVSGAVFDSDTAAPVNAVFLNEQVSTEEANTELWYVLNPNPGSGDVEVSIINDTDPGGGFEDSVIVSAIVMSDVDQLNPFGTSIQFAGRDNETEIIGVPSEPGDLVLGLLAVDDQRGITSNAGQIDIFGPVGSEGAGEGLGSPVGESPPSNDGAEAIISAKVGPSNASSVDFSWSFGGTDSYAVVGVAIKAVDGQNSLTAAQSPTMASTFTMPTDGVVAFTVFVEVDQGATLTLADIDASLNINGGASVFTSAPNSQTLIGASGSGPNGGDVYRLDFSDTLNADVTVDPGEFLEFIVVNNGSVPFDILYDSTTYNTCIALPAITVIDVESVQFFDAPFPDGSQVTTASVGEQLYIRTIISDPFGTSDITNPTIQITDPNSLDTFTPNPGDLTSVGTLVDSDTDSVTYEYVWRTGSTEGSYDITVAADEGTEGTVSDSLTQPIILTKEDSGTPSFVEFTSGNDGTSTDTFGASDDICVRLFDFDENENSGLVETVQVTITTTQGDSDVVTLTETGADTGIFTACFPSATDSTNADDGDINAPVSTGLVVSYVDDDNPLDTAEDQAAVPSVTANDPQVVVSKTLIEPSDGGAIVGEQAIYSISVTNVGSTALNTTELVDTFVDSELTFVSASIAPDTNVLNGLNRELTWNDLGALAIGESATVTITFTVAAGGSINNTADVTATSGFGNATDSDVETLSVTNPAVTVTKTLDGGSRTVFYGDIISYTIDIENTGNVNIESLPLVDNYSTSLEFLSASTTPDGSGGGVILWNDLIPGASTLNVGQTSSVTVTFRVVGESDPVLNSAEVRYAIDVNGDSAPAAEDDNIELIADAASVGDLVWEDTDGDGTLNGSETGIAGITVFLDLDGDGIRDSNEPFDVTDSNGAYRIGNLADGTYLVRIDEDTLDDALTVTTPGVTVFSVDLDPGEDDTTIDFGIERTTVTGNIFNDVNGNGSTTPDVGETGLGGIDVIITDVNGNTQTVRTAPDGSYSAEVPQGLTFVNVDEATLPAAYNLTTGNEPQSLTAGPGINTFDNIGYQQPQGVTGHLFIDTDGNATQDGGEPDLGGVTVFADLDNSGDFTIGEPTAVTDSAGNYTLEISSNTGNISIEVDETTLPAGLDTTPTTANDPQTVSVTSQTLSAANDVGYQFNGLGILKTSDVTDTVSPGDTIRYTVEVINNSGVLQDGIDITDTLPSNVTYVDGSLSVNAPADRNIVTDITDTFATVGAGNGGSPIATGSEVGWSADWVKIDEAANPGFNAGIVQVRADDDFPAVTALRIQGNGATLDQGGGATRAVNLGGVASATITFDYRQDSLEGELSYLDISNDGGVTYPVRLLTFDGVNNTNYVSQSAITIPAAYLTNSTHIRFISDPAYFSDDFDYNYIDNIDIEATENFIQLGTPGNFPINNEIGNDYALRDGDTITITYEVTVNTSPGATVANTASVVSNQSALVSSTVTDDTLIPPDTGSITGTVLSDTDGDGIGNQPIENVQLELLTSGGAQIDADTDLPGLQPTYAYTNSDGEYTFDELDDGTSYQVRQTQPSGFISVATTTPLNPTSPDVNVLGDDGTPIAVTGNTANSGNNFVEQEPATISGFVLEDFDLNGTGDTGIGGVSLELLDSTGASIDSDPVTAGVQPTTATTNANGEYVFNDLTPGVSYQVRQIQPAGYTSVSDADGGDLNVIGDVTLITVGSGANPGNTFVEQLTPGSISGTVLDDTDGDGIGDTGIDGVTVFLDLNNNGVFDSGFDVSTTTSGGGNYSFTGLRNGTYDVVEVDPSGYVSVSDTDGGDKNTTTVTVAPGENETGISFVDGIPATISGQVVNDANSNGINDSESGIDGVTVEIYEDLNGNGLLDFNETLVDTVVTSGGGNYSFSVPAGDYVIVETDPVNFFSTNDSDAPGNDNQIGLTVTPNGSSTGNEFLDANVGPAVAVTKTLDGGAQTAFFGDTVTYTIDIENIGNTAIVTLPLEDIYNQSVLEYQSATIVPDSSGSGSIVWNDLGALAVGATTSVTVTFRVIGEESPTTNTAQVIDAIDELSNDIDDAVDTDILLTTSTASISGTVWQDDDGDGIFDTPAESGFNGSVVVFIDLDGNGTRGINEPQDTVDPSGVYSFDNLAAGTYRVRVDPSTLPTSTSFALTAPTPNPYFDITVGNSTDSTGNDFGYEPQVADLAISKVSSAGASVDPGDTITYTVTVTNNDSITHTGIDIADTVPAGTTYVAASVTEVSAPTTYVSGTTTTNIIEDWETGITYAGGSPISAGGSLGWVGNWTEIGETTNVSGNDIRVLTDSGNNYLRTKDDSRGVIREINLSALNTTTDTAQLTFDWRTSGNALEAGDSVFVEIATNSAGPWTELAEVGLGTNTTTFLTVSTAINSSFFTAGTFFRIITDPTLANNEQVWFDNIDIEATQIVESPQTGSVGAPSALATNYALDPGDTLIVTYQVLVDDYPGVSVIENTATLTSTQQPDAINSTTFDPVDVGALSGSVTQDTNGDVVGDVGISGNTLELQLANGTQIDTDPVTPGIQPPIATTDAFGNFTFENVPVGDYRVVQTVQPAGLDSISDTDGLNDTINNIIGDESAITVTSGTTVADLNFIESETGTVSGFVYEDTNLNGSLDVGESGLSGVTVDLILDKNGNGEIDAGDIVFDTPATTSGTGEYTFTNVPVGTYIIRETDPSGYFSVSDSTLPNDNLIPGIVVTDGASLSGNLFFDGQTSANSDQDCKDDLLEYALSGDLETGVINSSWPKIDLIDASTGRFDLTFTRPTTTADITYTIEGSNDIIGSWFSIATIAANSAAASPFSVLDNGNGTETLTLGNIEDDAGYTTPDFGFVRIRVDLGATTLYTDVWGWEKTDMTLDQCNSFGNPFTLQEAYCGGIDSLLGDQLTLTSSSNGTDFGALLASGDYYIEVTSGDLEGARFQIASGGVNTVTLLNDSDLYSPSPVDSLNTRTGVPALLASDRIKIIRYRTLGEMFDLTGAMAGQSSGDPNNATHLYIYNNRLDSSRYDAFMITDLSADFAPFYTNLSQGDNWILESGQGNFDAADEGLRIIDPSTGFLMIPKQAAPTLYAFGKVRAHDADVVLNSGFNLVGSMYPLDQVPIDGVDSGDNGLDLADTTFTAGADPDAATEIILWHTDPEIGVFDTTVFMLLDSDGSWIDFAEVGAPPFTNVSDSPADLTLQSNRARFIKLPGSDQFTDTQPEPTP